MRNLAELSDNELKALNYMLIVAAENPTGFTNVTLRRAIAGLLECKPSFDVKQLGAQVTGLYGHRDIHLGPEAFVFINMLNGWDYVDFNGEPTKERFLKTMGHMYDVIHERTSQPEPIPVEHNGYCGISAGMVNTKPEVPGSSLRAAWDRAQEADKQS